MSVLAIIPAREHSKGIPRKNWIKLVGITPLRRAINCAREVRQIEEIVISTDVAEIAPHETGLQRITILRRPPELATDDAPMIDVIQHALAQVPGPPEQIIVLLQPTQPLRTPEHVKAAIALLETTRAHSVVSVVELPRTHHPEVQLAINEDGRLFPHWEFDAYGLTIAFGLGDQPATRQSMMPTFIRDGTVYAFRRKTVTRFGNIYGEDVRPLIIPASETCALDTPSDWAEAERRLKA